VWGAEGPNAFDCSSLTQYVYQKHGIELPRRAISQSKVGDLIGRRLQRGDLRFFSTDSRQSLVTHVGIYEGGGVMIEASKRYGRVRRDRLDDAYWMERFMFARRIAADGGVVPVVRPDGRDSNRRRTAIRIAERLVDILIRRPR
jgi:peptidoglycan DL-endopeptidase LytE